MARSGERARNLRTLVSRVADVRDKVTLKRPTWDDLLAVGVGEEVTRIYRMMGGIQDRPRVAPGPWDLQIDEIAIELDEENHFKPLPGTNSRLLALSTLGPPRRSHVSHVVCKSRDRLSHVRQVLVQHVLRAGVRSARASCKPQWPRSAALEAARILRPHQGSQSDRRVSEGHEGLDLRVRVVQRKCTDSGRAASQR